MSSSVFAPAHQGLSSPRRWLLTAVTAVALLGLAACGTSTLSQYNDQNQVTEAVFPKAESVNSWYASGVSVSAGQLKNLRVGSSRGAAQNVLGLPNFAERQGAREWDYLLNVLNNDGATVTRCQLKLVFDGDKLVQSLHWLPAGCADLLANPAAVALKEGKASENLRLATDALFAFDRAELNALGMSELDNVAKKLASDYKKVDAITITGHADRLGADRYNEVLSAERASSVRKYLVSKGVDHNLISSKGVGSTLPIETCKGVTGRSALIECLMPNRRVEVEITGSR